MWKAVALALAIGMIGAAYAAGPLDALAGRYLYRFQNSTVEAEKYMSEDILEVVPVSADAAYVRTHLEFFNGHSCSFYGVMRVTDDVLEYAPDKDSDWDPECRLRLKQTGDKVVLEDKDSRCAAYGCGARGVFDGASFAISSKRKISYIARLKASQEYRDAIKEAARNP